MIRQQPIGVRSVLGVPDGRHVWLLYRDEKERFGTIAGFFTDTNPADDRDGKGRGAGVERWVAEHVLDEEHRLAEFIRSRNAAAA